MQTAAEIVRALFATRPVALGVERFSSLLQPQLDRLTDFPYHMRRAALSDIFASAEYQQSWGNQARQTLGIDLEDRYQADFEALLFWAVDHHIPLIGLDASTQDRQTNPSLDVITRNHLWTANLGRFMENHPDYYHYIVIGGERHITNDQHSFPTLATSLFPPSQVVSIGQRYANPSPRRLNAIKLQAGLAHIDCLVIVKPEFALIGSDNFRLNHPPDYWIAVHSPRQG